MVEPEPKKVPFDPTTDSKYRPVDGEPITDKDLYFCRHAPAPHRFVRDKLHAVEKSDHFHFFDKCKYCGVRREKQIYKKLRGSDIETIAEVVIYMGTQFKRFPLTEG